MPLQYQVELIHEIKISYPKKYKVILLNDDYTSMEFVIDILITIFHKTFIQAESIMLEIHKQEQGVCGVYTHEIAQSKILEVHKKARENGFPLKCVMEEE